MIRALAALTLILQGCGSPAPGAGARPAHSTSSAAQQAQRTHEYPSPPAPRPPVIGTRGSAVDVVRAFASGYINWDATTVSARLQALAQRSVHQARSAMQLAAAETSADYELRRGGIANHGTVEAVAPLRRSVNRFVVVTRELTTATLTTAYAGLRPAWHVIVASVTQLPRSGWVVSGWQPES